MPGVEVQPPMAEESGPMAMVVSTVPSLSNAPAGGKAPPPPPVASHTKAVGMIHPPPDTRNIVDKTASFVARNGPEFERRIFASNQNNVRFNFLIPTDPYHAYYQHKIAEFKAQFAGEGTAKPAGAPGGATAAPDGQLPVDGLTPAVAAKPAAAPALDLVPPEPEQYTVRLPDGINGLDLDIIRLTAQFVARNGKNFLAGLTSREHMNPQFHFLKPAHSMFTFFTALADAYSRVLMPPKGLVDKLKRDAEDRNKTFERCNQRLDWEKSQQRLRQQAEDEVEQERVQMALIDWHDFVVVETIEFADDEDEELPMPMSLDEVLRRTKALADEAAFEEEIRADAAEKEMAMDMDEEELELVQQGLQETKLEEGAGAAKEAEEGEEEEEEEEEMEDGVPPPPEDDALPLPRDEELPIRVVKNWKRPEERVQVGGAADLARMVVSPITGELIPASEMEEHMRISLIDPKYKEQKERMIAKLRETTLAQDDEIARNIVSLARTRPDIFGTTDEEVFNAVKAEISKKQEDPKQPIWDGQTGSIGRVTTQAMSMQPSSIEEQMAAAHRERMAAAGETSFGPAAPPSLLKPPPHAGPGRPLPPPPGMNVNVPRPTSLPPPHHSQGPPPPPPQSAPPRPHMMMPPPPAARAPPPPPLAPSRMPPGPPPMFQQRQSPLLQPPPPPMTAPLPTPPMQQHRPPLMPPPPPTARPPFMPPPPLPTMQPPPPPLPVGGPPMFPPPPMPAPPDEPPPPPPEEPEPKRQKVDEIPLVPEDRWLSTHPGLQPIRVLTPVVEGEDKMNGRTIEVTVLLSETVGALKEKVANTLGVPANKLKLSARPGFLKDSATLAFYNLVGGETISLGLKERGGKKR